MSIFRHVRRNRGAARLRVRVMLRLQSALALVCAFLLYTAITTYLWTPAIVSVRDQDGEYVFLSTDCKDPVRASLVHAIQNAQKSVVLIIYSLSDKKIIGALRDAAHRGVEVVLIHDATETHDGPLLVGKQVKCYPRRGQGLMHSKLLVIDHSNVWVGSANMSTPSLTEQGNLVIALRSPVIAEAIETMARSMISHTPYPRPPITVKFSDSSFTLFFHPFHGARSYQSLLERIDKASKRIFVAMFTFTHQELVSALCRAKARGVDVRVILDKDSSSQTSRKSFVRFQREHVPCGYRTKTGLLHYKIAVIDSTLVAGSCNWTRAGFTSNHEAMVFIDPLPPAQQQWIDQWWESVARSSTIPTVHMRTNG